MVVSTFLNSVYIGAILASRDDSPRPVVRNTRLANAIPPAIFWKRGAHCCSNIGLNSDGGPGKRTTQFFSPETHSPGAVPWLFTRISDPVRISACRALFAAI